MRPNNILLEGKRERKRRKKEKPKIDLDYLTDKTKWGITNLCLRSSKNPEVLNKIAHICFTNLTILSVWNNQIQSIEELPRVNMPRLRQLYLGNNNITSVGVIRKADWTGLQFLSMDDNYFGDVKVLVQGCFPLIRMLFVYSQLGDENKFTEHCFPPKLETQFLQSLYIRKNKLSFDRCTEKILQKRWPNIK